MYANNCPYELIASPEILAVLQDIIAKPTAATPNDCQSEIVAPVASMPAILNHILYIRIADKPFMPETTPLTFNNNCKFISPPLNKLYFITNHEEC